MALHALTESQLDLVYFALNYAVEMAKEDGTEMPFVVADRELGRELTFLEDVADACSLTGIDPAVVVRHEVLPSTTSEGTPALVIELSDIETEDTTIVQAYRPGGPHRRFALLGEPFILSVERV